jgi:hypothetical protein
MDWQTEYLTEDRVGIKDPMSGSSLSVLESSPIDLFFQMDGSREPVSVPAGDFPQAIKVLHSFTLNVTLLQSSGNFGGLLTLNTTQWYEPYVGLVRAQVDSASLSIGLQKLNIPMQSTVELVEFIAGK